MHCTNHECCCTIRKAWSARSTAVLRRNVGWFVFQHEGFHKWDIMFHPYTVGYSPNYKSSYSHQSSIKHCHINRIRRLVALEALQRPQSGLRGCTSVMLVRSSRRRCCSLRAPASYSNSWVGWTCVVKSRYLRQQPLPQRFMEKRSSEFL